jgi:hypothetical protein
MANAMEVRLDQFLVGPRARVLVCRPSRPPKAGARSDAATESSPMPAPAPEKGRRDGESASRERGSERSRLQRPGGHDDVEGAVPSLAEHVSTILREEAPWARENEGRRLLVSPRRRFGPAGCKRHAASYAVRVSDGPFRVPAPRPPPKPDPYLAAWRDVRRRRIAQVVCLLVLLPVGVLSACLAIPRLGDRAVYVEVLVDGLFMVALVWLGEFRCPKCRNDFEARPRALIGAPPQCKHCGIAIGTPTNTSTRDAP